jgi:hypothetical protein
MSALLCRLWRLLLGDREYQVPPKIPLPLLPSAWPCGPPPAMPDLYRRCRYSVTFWEAMRN